MKSLIEFITESTNNRKKHYNPCSFSALKRNHKELYNLIENDKILSEIAKIKGLKFYQDPNEKFHKNLIQIEMYGKPSSNDSIIKQIKEITGKYVNFETDRDYWDDGHVSKYKHQFGWYNLDDGKIYSDYNDAKNQK